MPLWPRRLTIRRYGGGSPIWERKFHRASSRRLRRLAPFTRPKLTNGGRLSNRRTSRRSEPLRVRSARVARRAARAALGARLRGDDKENSLDTPRTLYRKIVDAHTVRRTDDRGGVLLYVDRQVLNEYTSPQAFSALRNARRRVWRPQGSLAVVDHVNPTTPDRTIAIADAARARPRGQ